MSRGSSVTKPASLPVANCEIRAEVIWPWRHASAQHTHLVWLHSWYWQGYFCVGHAESVSSFFKWWSRSLRNVEDFEMVQFFQLECKGALVPCFLLVVFNRRVPLGSVFNFRHLSLPPSREFDESLHTSALYIISPGCKSSCGYFRHSSKLPSKRSTATQVKWSTWHRTPSMHTLLFRRLCKLRDKRSYFSTTSN